MQKATGQGIRARGLFLGKEMEDVKSLLLSYVSYFTEHVEKRARAILDSISCVYH